MGNFCPPGSGSGSESTILIPTTVLSSPVNVLKRRNKYCSWMLSRDHTRLFSFKESLFIKKVEFLTPCAGPTAVDITPGKDGGILKEITTQGVVGDGPLLGDKVSTLDTIRTVLRRVAIGQGHSLFLFHIPFMLLSII